MRPNPLLLGLHSSQHHVRAQESGGEQVRKPRLGHAAIYRAAQRRDSLPKLLRVPRLRVGELQQDIPPLRRALVRGKQPVEIRRANLPNPSLLQHPNQLGIRWGRRCHSILIVDLQSLLILATICKSYKSLGTNSIL